MAAWRSYKMVMRGSGGGSASARGASSTNRLKRKGWPEWVGSLWSLVTIYGERWSAPGRPLETKKKTAQRVCRTAANLS